jgi:hypothetical protein
LKYIDPSGHDLSDSQGNDIEYIDSVIRSFSLLKIYGYTVDINIGELMTEEYMFVNDLRILEAKGEIEHGTIDRYIEDEEDWIVQKAANKGFEIIEKPEPIDWIIVADTIAFAGDIVSFIPRPPIAIAGYAISSAASVASYFTTAYRYQKGEVNYSDLLVSEIACIYGFIPWYGVVFSGGQLGWDLINDSN